MQSRTWKQTPPRHLVAACLGLGAFLLICWAFLLALPATLKHQPLSAGLPAILCAAVCLNAVFLLLMLRRALPNDTRNDARNDAALRSQRPHGDVAYEQAMLANVADVVCALDKNGRFLWTGAAAQHCWGFTSEELHGRWLINFLIEDDIAATTKALSEIASLKIATTFECRMKRKDRLVIDTLWSAYWSIEEDCMFCISHEFTERRKAERLLAESESQIRAMFDNMPIALIVFDDAGNIETLNPAAQKMFGYGAAEALNKPVSALIAGDKSREITLRPNQYLGKILNADARTKTGECFTLELTISHFLSPIGHRFLLSGLDVTERHELEKLKQDFHAIIGHELRTPLTSVRAFLSMFAEEAYGPTSEPVRSRAASASQQVTRLIGLINNLLDSQKFESGYFDFCFLATNLRQIIAESVDAVSDQATRRGIVIQTEFSDGDFTLEADQARLVQVLINLLGNAIKFSPPGETVIIITREAGTDLHVSVIDHGPGIAMEAKEQIFEKYRQLVDPSTGIHRQGTGLGLSICKTIIERHGGNIGVESQEGDGSCFWFHLPKRRGGF